jgi:hypothetical protein
MKMKEIIKILQGLVKDNKSFKEEDIGSFIFISDPYGSGNIEESVMRTNFLSHDLEKSTIKKEK